MPTRPDGSDQWVIRTATAWIKGKYMLTDNINFAGTLFLNKVDGFQGGVERDFTRIQLDLEFKFE